MRVPFGRMKVRATVDGDVAAEAIVKFMIQKPQAAKTE
jgi:3-hydroxymyristoyl/3-hydroxydecanoyl-(acyl carrier protein) dehydratase